MILSITINREREEGVNEVKGGVFNHFNNHCEKRRRSIPNMCT